MSTSASWRSSTAIHPPAGFRTTAALGVRASAAAVCVYLVASIAYVVTSGGVYVRLAQSTGLILLVAHLLWPRRDEWPIYALLVVAVAGYALRLHFQDVTSASQLLHVLAAVGAAVAFLRTPPAPVVLRLIVIGCAVFLALRIREGVFPEAVLTGRSGNHISVLMLAPALLTHLEEARRRQRLSLLPALLAALAATWALGRAGIVTSYAYLLVILWHRRRSFGHLMTWIAIAASLTLAVPFAIRNAWLIQLWFGSLFMKFRTKSFTEDPRFRVMSEYVESLELRSLLLGHEPVFVSHLGLSLHNSFLQWHFNFGAAALVIGAVTIGALAAAARRRRWFILFAVGLILVRSFSDTVLLAGLFDLPFLVCLALAFRNEGEWVGSSAEPVDA